MSDHTTTHDTHAHSVPLSLYYWTIGWLMLLLIVTLAAAYFDLGVLNLPIAMAIAVVKMAIIVWNFMHLRFNSTLVRLVAGAAFFWLLIMFVMTMSDYISRHWLDAMPM